MRQRAGGSESADGTGSAPRLSAGSSEGASEQSPAGRSPVLDAAQLEVLRRYGSEHDMAAGDVLFAAGDMTYDLIVVLAGGARLVERHGQPGETVITTYAPSQFLGEIGLLTGQRAYPERGGEHGRAGAARSGGAGSGDHGPRARAQ